MIAQPTPDHLRIGIAAIFRNERPYIVEWLAFHRVIGFDSFYIADNASNDGSTELLQALDRLHLLKWVPFPSPPGQAPQLPAYAQLLTSHVTDEDWIAVIDADEFIMPMADPWDFKSWLRQFHCDAGVGAVALNWAVYGSGWRQNHSRGLVIERFERRAPPTFAPNLHYKTVLRRSAFDDLAGNPHHFRLKPGFRYVHTDGQALQLHREHGAGLSQTLVWTGARVNHYIVKSKDEFVSRKQPNGSAASLTRIKDDRYFQSHDRNDKRDPVAQRLLDKVRAEVARIQLALRESGHQIDEGDYPEPRYFAPFPNAHGVVDSVELIGNDVHVRGWVFLPSGRSATQLVVRSTVGSVLIDNFEVVSRPDVQRHYPMAQTQCGFHLKLPNTCGLQTFDSLQVLAVEANGGLSAPLHHPRRLTPTA